MLTKINKLIAFFALLVLTGVMVGHTSSMGLGLLVLYGGIIVAVSILHL